MKKRKPKKSKNWRIIAIEFISVFTAVFLAFALNNWNENRRDNNAETKILKEISNGLKKDIEDIHINIGGHQKGILACKYWRKVIEGEAFDSDSIQVYYQSLTRDFVSIQNISGYETLKSKGLEIINNDSLRFKIISLYEYDFTTLKKFEETYYEMQFQQNYFKEINNMVSPFFVFNKAGSIEDIRFPDRLDRRTTNIFLSYLMKIEINRIFLLNYYSRIEQKVKWLLLDIENELNQ